MVRSALVAIAALCWAGAAVAQEEVSQIITPDRPGLGDGTHVVAAGVFQLETGTAFESGRGAESITFGQLLLRFGLGPFEARLLPGSAIVQNEDFGLVDPALGLKVPLVRGDVRLSTVLTTTLALGADAYSAGEATGAVTLVGEGSLSDVLGLAINAGYGFPWDDPGTATYTLIVTPGLSVTSVRGLSVYGGYAGFYSDVDDTHFVEAGLAYASDIDTQYDINLGLNTESRRFFVGVGIAHRWR